MSCYSVKNYKRIFIYSLVCTGLLLSIFDTQANGHKKQKKVINVFESERAIIDEAVKRISETLKSETLKKAGHPFRISCCLGLQDQHVVSMNTCIDYSEYRKEADTFNYILNTDNCAINKRIKVVFKPTAKNLVTVIYQHPQKKNVRLSQKVVEIASDCIKA